MTTRSLLLLVLFSSRSQSLYRGEGKELGIFVSREAHAGGVGVWNSSKSHSLYTGERSTFSQAPRSICKKRVMFYKLYLAFLFEVPEPTEGKEPTYFSILSAYFLISTSYIFLIFDTYFLIFSKCFFFYNCGGEEPKNLPSPRNHRQGGARNFSKSQSQYGDQCQ